MPEEPMRITKHNLSLRPAALAERLFALDRTFEKFDSTDGTVRRDEHERVLRLFEALDVSTQCLHATLADRVTAARTV